MFEKKLNPSFKKTVTPFQIDIINKKSEVGWALAYHSGLFQPLKLSESYLQYKRIEIKGLNEIKTVSKKETEKENQYIVLNIKINNLMAESAEVKIVKGDRNSEELNPIKFDSQDSLRQIEARIIIGVIVHDGNQYAGSLSKDFGGIETYYVIQFIQTNLIMANMVMDGIPVVYAVPISGGRLNF